MLSLERHTLKHNQINNRKRTALTAPIFRHLVMINTVNISNKLHLESFLMFQKLLDIVKQDWGQSSFIFEMHVVAICWLEASLCRHWHRSGFT